MLMKRDIILKEILKSPDDHELIKSLGKLYLDSCNSLSGIKLSIHFLEQSIQLDNRDSETWIELGKAWEKLYHEYPTEDEKEREQRLTNSSLGYRKSISLNPTSIQNRFSYSNYLSKLNKFREAALVLQDAIEISNQDGKLWYELGKMMKNWGTSESIDKFERLRLSIEAFNKAFELLPDDLYIKEALMDAKKVFELEVLEQEQRKQNDDVQVVKNNLGFTKLTSDMLVIPDFESLRHRQRNKTVQLDPNNEEIQDNHQNFKQNDSEPFKTVSPILKPLESNLDQQISPQSFSLSNKGKQREEVRSEERSDKSNQINSLQENEIEKILLESNLTKNQQQSEEKFGTDQVITSPRKVNESIFELPMNLSTCKAPEPSQLSPPAFNFTNQQRLKNSNDERNLMSNLDERNKLIEDRNVITPRAHYSAEEERSNTPRASLQQQQQQQKQPSLQQLQQPPQRPPSPSALPTPMMQSGMKILSPRSSRRPTFETLPPSTLDGGRWTPTQERSHLVLSPNVQSPARSHASSSHSRKQSHPHAFEQSVPSRQDLPMVSSPLSLHGSWTSGGPLSTAAAAKILSPRSQASSSSSRSRSRKSHASEQPTTPRQDLPMLSPLGSWTTGQPTGPSTTTAAVKILSPPRSNASRNSGSRRQSLSHVFEPPTTPRQDLPMLSPHGSWTTGQPTGPSTTAAAVKILSPPRSNASRSSSSSRRQSLSHVFEPPTTPRQEPPMLSNNLLSPKGNWTTGQSNSVVGDGGGPSKQSLPGGTKILSPRNRRQSVSQVIERPTTSSNNTTNQVHCRSQSQILSPPIPAYDRRPQSTLNNHDRRLVDHGNHPPPIIPPKPISRNNDFVDCHHYQQQQRPISRACSRTPGGARENYIKVEGSSEDMMTSTTLIENNLEDYNYALIDAHLQSIAEIDKERRKEIIKLRRKFDETDLIANSKRTELLNQLRKVCITPNLQRKNTPSVNHDRRNNTPLSVSDRPADCALTGIASIIQLLQQQQQQQQGSGGGASAAIG